MLFSKKQKPSYEDRESFSIRLAEELLRAELQKLYGPEIKIFQLDTEGTKVVTKAPSSIENVSSEERRWLSDATKERYVMFFGVIGPFERSFPDNPEEDKRRELRCVRATIRLYSVESGCVWWKPHFLKLEVFKVHQTCTKTYDMKEIRYVDGRFEGKPEEANAENPCEDMCASQTPANYPQFHGLTRDPSFQVARGDW